MFISLYRVPEYNNKKTHFISVVVAARNEENTLEACLNSLAAQDYPPDMHEIIVADDRSTDETPQIIKKFCEKYPHFKSVTVDASAQNVIPKKSALIQALTVARGDVISATDADCVIPETWLSSINSYFSDEVGMVVGHTNYPTPANQWQGIDAIDYFSQRALGVAFIGAGSAYTSTASNFAYRKSIYDKNKDDFAGLSIRPAEDNYFLHCAHKRSDFKIAVATEQGSFVTTKGAQSFSEFLHQRFRWSAYGGTITTTGMKLFFIPVLLYYCCLLAAPIPLVLNIPGSLALVMISLACKLIVDFLFMFKATTLFHCRYLLKYFVQIYLLHFVLIPVIVIRGNLFAFKWKGRKYTKMKEIKKEQSWFYTKRDD